MLDVRSYIILNGELTQKSNKAWGVIPSNAGIISDTLRYFALQKSPAAAPERC